MESPGAVEEKLDQCVIGFVVITLVSAAPFWLLRELATKGGSVPIEREIFWNGVMLFGPPVLAALGLLFRRVIGICWLITIAPSLAHVPFGTVLACYCFVLAWRLHLAQKRKPNQAPEPTPLLVTDRAGARSAPSKGVAHL